ncbi:ABC transporter permease [Microvirga subterranea]|uniref:Monosaccharide ABC transporter membrane protein (CUT2 family) n=1 Tax=Microvirga subterranea TaxID=186651 RepID=A0A370HW15_9HYPH|nr:ABC transporter permease [Microvirga subterranea]RDI61144.1 monosaccharide ABC transporter membrane protein (CUT2 family) [Microvirga subterranea]
MNDVSHVSGVQAADTGDFANVGRTQWWRRGFFASQTAYVAVALIVIMVIMSVLSSAFLSPGNLANVAKNFSFVGIVTLGVTLVIITGGIDLSVGSTMALSAITCAIVMQKVSGTGLDAVPLAGMIVSILCGLGVALLIGLSNGLLIAKVGLSPFVTTLGMLSIVRGLAYAVTEGRGQAPTGPDVNTFYELTDGNLAGVPVAVIYLLVLAAILSLVLHHTAFGRHVFALGGNEKAAALTGISVDRVKIAVYVLSSLSAGFAGILMVGWLGSAPANLATGYELTIIAAAVIGGANLTGGVGGPAGAVIGALLIEVIRNGLVLAGINAYWQIVLVGGIIILAVLVDRLRTLRMTP